MNKRLFVVEAQEIQERLRQWWLRELCANSPHLKLLE